MSRAQRDPILRILGFALAAASAALALSALPPVRRLESLAYDGRLELENRMRPVPRSGEIAIVGIDDQSLLNFGRWPWPREHLVDVVETLSALGARSIMMDVELPEPSRGSGATAHADGFARFVREMQAFALEQLDTDIGLLREKLAGLGLEDTARAATMALVDQVVTNSRTILRRAWSDPDRELAAAIGRARSRGCPVITAFHVEPGGAEAERVPRQCRWILQHPGENLQAIPRELAPRNDAERRQLEALASVLSPAGDGGGESREIALDAAFLHADHEVRQLLRRHGVEVRERTLSHLAAKALDAGGALSLDDQRQAHAKRSPALQRALDTEIARRRVLAGALEVAPEGAPGFPRAFDLAPPIPEVALEATHNGVINIIPDADGHTRSVPLLWSHEGHFLPSAMLALIMVELELATDAIRVAFAPGSTMLLVKKEDGAVAARFPVTPEGGLLVRYSGIFENAFPVISAGLLLDYQHVARERENWFGKQMRGNLYSQVLRLKDLASRRAEAMPVPEMSLPEMIEEMRREHPYFEIVPAETMITSFDGATDVSSRRPVSDWLSLLGALQRKLEEKHLAFQKAMAESVDSIADPVEKERKRAKIAPMIEPYRKYVQVAETLQTALRERVAGRHCMVGMTGSSSTDLGTTPLEPRAPLLQVFPQGLNTVTQDRHLRRAYLVDPAHFRPLADLSADAGVIALIALFCVPLFTVLSSLWGGVSVIALSALWITLSSSLFMRQGLWVDMVSPVMTILLSFALVFVWRARQRESLQQLFGRYLAGEVAEALMSDDSELELGGRQRVVTVMMTDLRGFTKLSEELGPRRMVSLLNEYLSRMTDPILEWRGTINEFIGDAILVLFGAPLSRTDDVDRALACGIAMQLALVQFNEENAGRGLPSLTMGIGINTGEVVAGNIGSLKRAKYGVVGDTVNTAARVESLTIGSQILLTAATAAACRSPVELCEPNEVRLKGKSEPLVVQELRGIEYQGVWYRMPIEVSVTWAHVDLRGRFSFLKGKTVSDEVEQATIISLNPGGARLTTATRLESAQDIVIHITWSEGQNSNAIYGRISKQHRQRVEGKAEWTWAEVVFTAMDDADRVLLEGMKRDQVDHASPLGTGVTG